VTKARSSAPVAPFARVTPRTKVCPGSTLLGSRLAQDPVDGRSADRALALGHVHAGLADLDGSLEVALLLALHAVAVVRLGLCGHGVLLRGSFTFGECDVSADRFST